MAHAWKVSSAAWSTLATAAVLSLLLSATPVQADVRIETHSEGLRILGRNASVAEIVMALGQQAGFETEIVGDAAAADSRDVDVVVADVATALGLLLPGSSYLLVYDAACAPERLRRVVIVPSDDTAAPALGGAEDPAAVAITIAAQPTPTNAPGTSERATASRIVPLHLLDTTEALDALEHALGDSDEAGRRWAIQGLGEFALLGHERAVLALGQVLFSETVPDNRVQAVDWLQALGDERSAAFLTVARRDPVGTVRSAATAH